MLSRRESDVMSAVYCLCDGTDGCLVSLPDILSILPIKRRYTAERIDEVLHELKRDGYLDLISSERKGERMYLISLKESGRTFKRNAVKRREDVAYKILTAFIGAFATFIFGLIIKAVFGS